MLPNSAQLATIPIHMNYQITCFCGNRFLITDQQLAAPVNCPACKRPLQPVVSTDQPAPTTPSPVPESAPATPVEAAAEATKRCPFCGEVILAIAKKCKHCGEFLDRATPPDGATPSPKPSPADVSPVFSLSVSQWDNFWKYIICVTIVVLVALVLLGLPSLREYAPLGISFAVVLTAFIAWFLYLSARNSRCYIRPTR